MQDAEVPSEVCGKEPLISEKTKEERNDEERKLGKNGCIEEAPARKSLIDKALLGGGEVGVL